MPSNTQSPCQGSSNVDSNSDCNSAPLRVYISLVAGLGRVAASAAFRVHKSIWTAFASAR